MNQVHWFAVPSPKLGTESLHALAKSLSRSGPQSSIFQQGRLPTNEAIRSFVNRVVRQARAMTDPAEEAVVMHSAAGLLLQKLTRGLANRRHTGFRFIHLDNRLRAGPVNLFGGFTIVAAISLPKHGRLIRWSEWITASRWESLIPNPALRVAPDRSLPEPPTSFAIDEFDYEPSDRRDSAYLQLSDHRADKVRLADRLGWRVIRAPELGHMAPVNYSDAVAVLCRQAIRSHPRITCE